MGKRAVVWPPAAAARRATAELFFFRARISSAASALSPCQTARERRGEARRDRRGRHGRETNLHCLSAGERRRQRKREGKKVVRERERKKNPLRPPAFSFFSFSFFVARRDPTARLFLPFSLSLSVSFSLPCNIYLGDQYFANIFYYVEGVFHLQRIYHNQDQLCLDGTIEKKNRSGDTYTG